VKVLREFIGDELIKALERAKEGICSVEFRDVVIVHHNDADGICAGTILYKSFSALGMKPGMVCIEKVHPAIIEKIHAREDSLIVYTDLGGLAGDIIRDMDAGRNLVLILDHHPAKEVSGEKILVIDSELFGVSGDVFISASTLTYLFCRYITDSEIEGCATLAVVGSVGDYHDRSGGILGYDRYALEQAIDAGEAKIKIDDSRERYFLNKFNEFADVVADYLTTLGSVGYYEGGYKLGMEAALHGFSDEVIKRANELKRLKDEKFKRKIEELKNGGIRKEKHVQWFHVGRDFMPMGVKVIGLFCHGIKDMSFIDEDKFVAGFQDFIPELPDLGRIDWEGVKVSFRAPAPLERKVLSGEVPGLDITLPRATERVGGTADASHRIAAASLIDKGREEELIREWEAIMEELSST
jgi:single-stranded DNA-specific DHH superfamily exonuclease